MRLRPRLGAQFTVELNCCASQGKRPIRFIDYAPYLNFTYALQFTVTLAIARPEQYYQQGSVSHIRPNPGTTHPTHYLRYLNSM